jgi:hypothetical protein
MARVRAPVGGAAGGSLYTPNPTVGSNGRGRPDPTVGERGLGEAGRVGPGALSVFKPLDLHGRYPQQGRR